MIIDGSASGASSGAGLTAAAQQAEQALAWGAEAQAPPQAGLPAVGAAGEGAADAGVANGGGAGPDLESLLEENARWAACCCCACFARRAAQPLHWTVCGNGWASTTLSCLTAPST